jgi:GAF domain-containing protein
MSIAPDLDRILQVIAALDRGMLEMPSPDAFLQQVLPEIAACIPQARIVRAYNISRNRAFLQASVGETEAEKRSIKVDPETFNHTQPIYDPQQQLWTIPLQIAGNGFGLLEVQTHEAPTPDLASWLQIIGHQMSASLRLLMVAAHELDISDRQTQVFNELNSSQDFVEMAQLIAHHLLMTPSRWLTMSAVIRDAQGNSVALQPLAGADRERILKFDRITVPDWRGISLEVQRMLEQGISFVMNDTASETAEAIGAGFQEWLEANGVQAMMTIPILVDGRLAALLNVISRVKTNFTREEMNAFSNVGGQLGALISVRNLLADAEKSRETANNLVLASRIITTAENYSDMLQSAVFTVAKEMTAVAITLFEPALTTAQHPRRRVLAAIGTAEDLLPPPTSTDSYGLPTGLVMGDLQRGTPVVIADITTDETYIAPEIRSFLTHLDIRWLAAFGLRAGDQLFGTLDIMHSQPYPLTPEEIDAYTTLADQIGSAIQGRRLLAQTEDALNFVQAQYETTSTIYAADNPEEILRMVHHFAAPNYDNAHFGLLEDTVQPPIVRILAEINKGVSPFSSRAVSLESYPAHDTLGAVEALYIPSVIKDSFLSADEREGLLGQGIQSLVIVPMVANQRVVGLVTFTHPKPNHMTAERLRALRSIADQMAIVFENKTLLRSTEDSLKEVEVLYGINHALLRAQDVLDVMRSVKSYLAPDAISLHRLVVSYVDPAEVDEVTLTHVIDGDGEQIVQTPLYRLIGPEKAAAINARLSQRRLQISFVEDARQPNPGNPLADFIQRETVWSCITLPIYEGEALREIVVIAFGYPQIFDIKKRRLYESVGDQMAIVLQSQRLLRETQYSATQLSKEVQVLQVLNQLALTMTSASANSTDVGEKQLLDRSSQALVSLLNIDHCSFVSFDANGSVGTIISEFPDKGVAGTRINLVDDPLISSAKSLQPMLFSDINNDPRLRESNRETLRALGVKSFLILPVTVRGNLIGSFGLDMFTDRQFTPDMVSIAQTITAQVAVGLQNIRLLNDAQRRAEQLQQVTAFSQRIQASLERANIFEIMIAETINLFTVNRMSIAVYDSQRGHLRVAAQYEDGKTLIDIDNGPIIPTTGTLIGQVWQSQESLYIADTSGRPELRQAYQSDIRSLLIAPVLSRGRTLGVINMGAFQISAYSDTDIAVFEQMLNQLAVALENTEIYSQTQRLAKNESLVNEISTQFQRQMDIDSMLDITMKELGKALGARRARIRLTTTDEDKNL